LFAVVCLLLDGFLYFPWVIPYSIALLILGVFYFRFFIQLPTSLRFGCGVFALIFLVGAVGFDGFGAREASLNGTSTVLYSVL
jgi:hypothetical protein